MVANPGKRFEIILGNNLDTDSVIGTWWFCQANNLDWNDEEQVRFRFVEPGGRIRLKKVAKGYTGVHIDTGRLHNPGQYFFDHHQQGRTKPSSASQLIFKKYPSEDHVAEAIINFAHWVDNGRKLRAAESCQGDFGAVLESLPNVLAGLQTENGGTDALPSEQVLKTGLAVVQSFYNNCLRMRKFFEDLNIEDGGEMELRCDRFILYGRTNETSKNLRNIVMRKMRRVRIIVAEYLTEGKIGISLVRQTKHDIGLELEPILQECQALDPSAELFKHDSGKFLYIRGGSGALTLERIWQIVEQRFTVEALNQEMLEMHEEKTLYHATKAAEYSSQLNESGRAEFYSNIVQRLKNLEIGGDEE